MAITLLEAVQQNLGYPALLKIDTTTDQVFANDKTAKEDNFSQAAVPAVLTALYLYAESDEGAAEILKKGENINWIDRIFFDKRTAVVQTIAAYSELSKEDLVLKMNTIANEAIRITKENLAHDAGIIEVKIFFKSEINNIELYLLPTLHIGELLHVSTLDDNTNKMEGPISSLMNRIGDAFSNPVTEDEVKM
jgi:hypothetical protein